VLPNVECKSVTDFQGYFLSEIERINGLKQESETKLKKISDKLKALKDPRLALNVKKETLKKQAQSKADQARLQALLIEKESEHVDILSKLSAFTPLEGRLKAITEEMRTLQPAYDEYQQNIRIAGLIAEKRKELDSAAVALETRTKDLSTIEASLAEIRAGYDAEAHAKAKASCETLAAGIASIAATIKSDEERLSEIDKTLHEIEECLRNIASLKEKRSVEVDYLAFVERAREVIRMAGPEVIRVYIDLISKEATEMYCEIAGDRRFEIRWTQDYDILLIEDGRYRAANR
jgi:DNA repair protein SbcC/Rad50